MDVKDAVKMALGYAQDLFQGENVSDLGLEEVETDDAGNWVVTIGFSRPWDYPRGALASTAIPLGLGRAPRRSYKSVKIQNDRVVSVKNRES